MNCNVCGAPIPQRANACPQCGTIVSSSTANGGSSMTDPTIASSSPYNSSSNVPYNNVPQAPPYGQTPGVPYNQPVPPYASGPQATPYNASQWPSSTSYGSDPYSIPPPPPQVTDPYNQARFQPTPYPPAYQPPAYQPPVIPPARQRRVSVPLIIGIVVLLFILIGAGIFALFKASSSSSPSVAIDPSANPYGPKTGMLVVNDPLQDNSKGYQWDESTSIAPGAAKDTISCNFVNSVYHLSETQKGGMYCDPEAPSLFLNNLAFEVKASVVQGDSVGLTIREDQSRLTGYLFSIDIKGNYALGISDGSTPANNKTLSSGKSSAIKQGLNQVNVLAFSANGPTLDAYVNNTLLASVQDSTFTGGQVGIYAAGANVAYDIAVTSARLWRMDKAAPVLNSAQNPYFPKTGTPTVSDPMIDNSKGYGWAEVNGPVGADKNDIGGCAFTAGAYHVKRSMAGGEYCLAGAQGITFDNLAYEVNLTLITGSYNGIMFHFDPNKSTGYLFMIGIQQNYSLYSFNYKNPDTTKQYTLLRSGTNTIIKRGLHQNNTLAVIARGSIMSFYVNNQFVDVVSDSTYTNGQIGVYVEGEANGEEAAANNAHAWKL
jgi:hypothetical protein